MEDKKNLVLAGNPRYQPKQMKDIFGYDNLYQTVAQVEIATMQTLGEIEVIPKEVMAQLTSEIIQQLLAIPTSKVDEIERQITKHDVRAWVRIAQEIIKDKLAKWVHIPLTSYDVIDTGRMLQFRNAYNQALKSSIKEVIGILIKLVEEFAEQVQIGRTHGQHALPITVGFWLATILHRIVYNWEKLDVACDGLVGKISGAVGAYSAQIALGFNERCKNKTFEQMVLEKLSLKPARISSQILPLEPLAYFLFSCCMLSASLAQFGRDCRHLMRTEIAEVAESFVKGQVGSSTMAHKRNPINFENLEGMWWRTKNEFGKVFDTLISEHQRDLVGSCVARDFPIIVINLQQQLNTLLRKDKNGAAFLERITIDEDVCLQNFQTSSHLILAEPLYIALQMAGFPGDAHQFVNEKLVPQAIKQGETLFDVLEELAEDDKALWEIIRNIPAQLRFLFNRPEEYIGLAKEKSLEITGFAKEQIKIIDKK